MTYAVVKVTNGSYAIAAEGITNVDSAKVNFHGLCQALWNAPDVQTACVMIVDEHLLIVEGYREDIVKAEPEA